MTRLEALLFAAAIAATGAIASPAGAQDIVMQAKRMGRPVPAWYKRQVAKNPHRYEFRHAWKSSLKKARAQRAAARASGTTSGSTAAPGFHRPTGVVQGTFSVPVLPIVFAGTTAPYDYSTLQGKLFGAGSATSETVTRVYQEQSRGLLTLTGETFPWISVSGTNAYYAGTSNGGGPDAHLGALFKAVLDSADKTVDFSKFDQDHDGFVDFVAFVQPLAGGECGTSGIWSHRSQVDYELGAPYLTQDHDANGQPIYVSDYVIQPAINCATFGGGPIDIGVFAHEFGHAFGLPDLYSTSYENAGIGDWGLMSSGSYNTVDSPALMEGWSRVQLGWAPIVTIARDTTISLAPLETNGPVLRLNIPGTDEYFLLENRQRIGSDAKLYGTGLLIFHVDSATVNNGWETNNFQDSTYHKGLDVVEANGLDGLDNVNYYGSAGDIFPGSSSAVEFSPTSAPASNSYIEAGTTTASGISITGIAESGTNVTFRVSFGASGPVVMKWGDVNSDGVVSARDYEALYGCFVGSACAPGLAFDRGDVDSDGRLTVADALIIHSYLKGLNISPYRVGQPLTAPAPHVPAPAPNGAAERGLGGTVVRP